jgi:hypothetical protein
MIYLVLIQCFHEIEKKLVAKIKNKTQSKMTLGLLDSKISGAFLDIVNPSFNSEKGGRDTVVVAKARTQTATKNETQQTLEHFAMISPVTQSSRSY